ncbi:unnamed protein product [Closterium sp. Naga37s-1]|nr:unnamed protein product [Closterium sp. Naga37s-1]
MDTPSSEPALAPDSSTSAEDVEEVEIEVVDEPRRADFQEKVRRLRQGVASMFVDADRVVLVTSNIKADSCYSVVHQERILLSSPLSPCLPPTPISGSGVYAHDSRLMTLGRGFKLEPDTGDMTVPSVPPSPLHLSIPLSPQFSPNPLPGSRLMTLGRGFKPEPDTGDILTPIFAELRATLTPFEVGKYRILARQCGELLGEVARGLRRGMTEKEVAGAVAGACYSRGIHPILLLVGADERMDKWRHPLPTSSVAKLRLIITLSGWRHGLIASLSRVIHYLLPSDSPLRYKHAAVTYVDSVVIALPASSSSSASIFVTFSPLSPSTFPPYAPSLVTVTPSHNPLRAASRAYRLSLPRHPLRPAPLRLAPSPQAHSCHLRGQRCHRQHACRRHVRHNHGENPTGL